MRRAPRTLLGTLLAAVVVVAGACSSDADDDASPTTTTVAATTTTSAPEPTEAPRWPDPEPADLTLRPVLSSVPCEAGEQGPDLVAAVEGPLCYELGEVAVDGTHLRDPAVVPDPVGGGAGVEVQVAPEAADALDALLDACFQGAPTCPPGEGGVGYVAVQLGDEVVTAPAVQDRDLATDRFAITGGFTAEEAEALAAALGG